VYGVKAYVNSVRED
jgi:hypothetical protein